MFHLVKNLVFKNLLVIVLSAPAELQGSLERRWCFSDCFSSLLQIAYFELPCFQWQSPSLLSLELAVVDIESDIDLDPVVEHSLFDLSRRSLDDSSNLGCTC